MCFFNYPSGDDFITANYYTQHGWIKTLMLNYFNHTARYFAIILTQSSFNPLTYDHTFLWYKIYALINIGFFIFCIWFVIHSLNKFYLKMTTFKSFIVLFVVLFMYITNTKSVAESFYWFTGYSVYNASLDVFLISIGLWIYFINTKYSFLNLINYIFILILMFFAMGGQEPFSAWILLISVYYLYWAFKNKKDYRYFLTGLFVIVLSGFLIMYLAPGNRHRIGDNRNILVDTNIFRICAICSISIFRNFIGIIKWFFSINILMPFVLIFYCLEYIKKIKFNKYVLFSFVIYMFLGYFISLYAYYGLPYPHLMNMIYFAFVISLIYVICWIIKLLNENNLLRDLLKYPAMRFLILIFIFFNAVLYSSNIRDAYLDLYTGKAISFYSDRENMYNKLRNSKEDIVNIDDAIYAPKTCYVRDPWVNYEYISEYFKKKNVIVNWDKSITDKEVDLMRGAILKRFVKKKLGFKDTDTYKERI
jgi:hypothetical protein